MTEMTNELVLCCGRHSSDHKKSFSTPSKLLEMPVTWKLLHMMSIDTELHADKVHPSTITSDALLSRPVGVCSWLPLAIHSIYCLQNYP